MDVFGQAHTVRRILITDADSVQHELSWDCSEIYTVIKTELCGGSLSRTCKKGGICSEQALALAQNWEFMFVGKVDVSMQYCME